MRILVRAHDLSVAHVNDAVAVLSGFRIVRDHQHGLPQFLVGLAQHVEYDFRVFRIQVAGGLVGQHDRRPVDESTRQCHSLLLAAGQFRRAMIQPPVNAEHSRDLLQERRIRLGQAGNIGSNFDV